MRRAAQLAGCFVVLWSTLAGCTYGTSEPDHAKVDSVLLQAREAQAIVLSDRLEALIADGLDATEDREFAYVILKARAEPATAEDAFARAATAGRVAQLKGLNAGTQISEMERYGHLSLKLDPTYRYGAAQRLLGSLYVLAPAAMLDHGDSEIGLEMLEELVKRYPDELEHRVALVEAYVELDDVEPARPHLCLAKAQQDKLRADTRRRLTDLWAEVRPGSCDPP